MSIHSLKLTDVRKLLRGKRLGTESINFCLILTPSSLSSFSLSYFRLSFLHFVARDKGSGDGARIFYFECQSIYFILIQIRPIYGIFFIFIHLASGEPPWLRGFVCTFHSMIPGLRPELTVYVLFQNLRDSLFVIDWWKY